MTPVELLQRLIQFDTTNPPGNERPCVEWVGSLLEEAGIEYELFAKEPERPNLVARLPGDGTAAGLLLYGHVDVVTTAGQPWTRPPFEARIEDGYVWGRGALDMKSGVAMLVSAFLRAKREELRLRGDVTLAVLADEENGGDLGARFLVEEHPELFEGVTHALGEFGGFTMHLGGRRIYPIQVAEKQICWLKVTVRGPGGHAAIPVRGRTMGVVGDALRTLDRKQPPIHVTPVARRFVEAVAATLPRPQRLLMKGLLDRRTAPAALRALGAQRALLSAGLRNTASATIVRGGDKINVVPAEVELEVDGRLLPGYTPDDLIGELHELLGEGVTFELIRHDPGPAEPDLTHFETLSEIIREFDPDGVPVPLLQVGVTDGRFFSRLGIQTYGFLPMQLPEELVLSQVIHAADERIPVDTIDRGADAVFEAVRRLAATG